MRQRRRLWSLPVVTLMSGCVSQAVVCSALLFPPIKEIPLMRKMISTGREKSRCGSRWVEDE